MKDMKTGNWGSMDMDTAKYMSAAMDDIFDILKGFYTGYGAVLKTSSVETAIRQQWIYELISSKVDEEMLRKGMSRAKAHSLEDKFCKWPSIMDFISWCHGIPAPEAAYFETLRNSHDLTVWEPSHPIVALAGKRTGLSDLRNNENQKHYKNEYIRVYCEMLSRVLEGEEFTYKKLEKPLAITEKKLTDEDIARNKEHLSKLMAMVAEDDKKKKEIPTMTKEQIDARKEQVRAQANAWIANRGDK